MFSGNELIEFGIVGIVFIFLLFVGINPRIGFSLGVLLILAGLIWWFSTLGIIGTFLIVIMVIVVIFFILLSSGGERIEGLK